MAEWSRWNARLQACTAGLPGELCSWVAGQGGTIIVGLTADPSFFDIIEWSSLASAGVPVVCQLSWGDSCYVVDAVADPWLTDGLQAGDKILTLEQQAVNGEDENFTNGGLVSVQRGTSVLDLTLSPLPS